MKTPNDVYYFGTRDTGIPLVKRLYKEDVRIFYPSDQAIDFEWGYGGAGPAQLAEDILFDVTKDRDYAQARAPRFKEEIISRLGKEWGFTAGAVWSWMSQNPLPDWEKVLVIGERVVGTNA